MAIAHVQSRGTAGKSLAYSGAVTAGSLLVCGICSAGNITQVSDSVNGNWTKAVDEDGLGGTEAYTEIWYFANTGAGTPTVSFTGGFDGFESMAIAEYSGVATASPLDQTQHAFDASGTTHPDTGNTATTTQADELLIGVFGNPGSRTITPGDSFTERYDETSNSRAVWLGDKIVSATGAYKASGTSSSTGERWAATIATFKAAGGGEVVPILGCLDEMTRTYRPAPFKPGFGR